MPNAPALDRHWLPAAFAGLAASLVGIGLARFAYTPLLPALIQAGWFSESDAVYLGAANLAGYLAGAAGAGFLARHMQVAWLLRFMMLFAGMSFLACAQPVSFTWYFIWRFGAGVAGGVLMVMAASVVLPTVPAAKRGLAGGIIFTGVGLGIALSGTAVPALIKFGLKETWIALGIFMLLASAAVWQAWPIAPTQENKPTSFAKASVFTLPLSSLYIVYGLIAVGLVAHMVFLVDYVARGLGHGIAAGATFWIAFGAGALIGPVGAGRLADAIGFKATLRLFLFAETIAVALALADGSPLALYASSVAVGAIVPGVVPLVVGRAHHLSGDDAARHRSAWSLATIAFSIGQAGAGYAFSYVFTVTGRYDALFAAGALAAGLALVIDLLTPEQEKSSS